MARLLERFRKEIIPTLCKEMGYKNPLEAPRLQKIVVNVGAGEGSHNAKVIETVTQDLSLVTGQRPIVTKARKSISNFKIREGSSVGCCVTLRGRRMYEFLDRLVNVALPRIRDFRGISPNGFDERGNYTLGIREHVIFPEIDYEKVESPYGMNITLVVRCKNKEESRKLLRHLGLPFRSS